MGRGVAHIAHNDSFELFCNVNFSNPSARWKHMVIYLKMQLNESDSLPQKGSAQKLGGK